MPPASLKLLQLEASCGTIYRRLDFGRPAAAEWPHAVDSATQSISGPRQSISGRGPFWRSRRIQNRSRCPRGPAPATLVIADIALFTKSQSPSQATATRCSSLGAGRHASDCANLASVCVCMRDLFELEIDLISSAVLATARTDSSKRRRRHDAQRPWESPPSLAPAASLRASTSIVHGALLRACRCGSSSSSRVTLIAVDRGRAVVRRTAGGSLRQCCVLTHGLPWRSAHIVVAAFGVPKTCKGECGVDGAK